MTPSKRVLVTGSSGFIGRNTLPYLQSRGFEVHSVQRSGTDLLDEAAQRRLMESIQPSHLLHLAWDVTPGSYWTSLNNIDWVRASLSLFRAFAECGGRRWMGAGTCAEYDWSFGPVFNETVTPLKPQSLYGVSKLSLGLLQESMARELGVSFAWGRIFYLYGPHEPPGRLVPSLICSLLQRETAVCRQDRLLRDMLHSCDVARAFVEVLDSDLTGAVNIGSGRPASLGAVAQEIAAACGRPDLLELGRGRFPSTDPAQITADVSRLRSIGFAPRLCLEDGLRETVEWWRSRLVEGSRPPAT